MLNRFLFIACLAIFAACGPEKGQNTEDDTMVEGQTQKYDQAKVDLLCRKWSMSAVYTFDSLGTERKASNESEVTLEFKKDFTFVSTYKTMVANGIWKVDEKVSEVQVKMTNLNGKPVKSNSTQVYKLQTLTADELVYLCNKAKINGLFREHYKAVK